MTILFRRAHIEKEKLREIIFKNPESLEPGLRFIDCRLGTAEEGVIDFLGVDKSGRLAIVNCEVAKDDAMMLTALSQMHWLKKNESLVKRLFFSENIDITQTPQIILINESFSEKVMSAVPQLISYDVRLVEFKYIIAGSNDAIMFEDVLHTKNLTNIAASFHRESPQNKPEICAPAPAASAEESGEKTELSFDDIVLTPEEIAEFMKFDRKPNL